MATHVRVSLWRHLPVVEALSVEGVVKEEAGGAEEEQQPHTPQLGLTVLTRHTGKTSLSDITDAEVKK